MRAKKRTRLLSARGIKGGGGGTRKTKSKRSAEKRKRKRPNRETHNLLPLVFHFREQHPPLPAPAGGEVDAAEGGMGAKTRREETRGLSGEGNHFNGAFMLLSPFSENSAERRLSPMAAVIRACTASRDNAGANVRIKMGRIRA